MSDLLPCPFCGGAAELTWGGEVGRWDTWDIGCTVCDANIGGPTGAEGDAAKALSVSAWNTRTNLPQSEIEGMLG